MPPTATVGPPTPRVVGMALALVLALGTSCFGASPVAAESLCFQAVTGQPGSRTIEQLRLDFMRKRVTGFYNWFPWQKDRRVGRFEGAVTSPAGVTSPGTVRVLYRFMQEGQYQKAPLTIVFNNRQARISWDPPENRGASPDQPMPDVLLPRDSCSQLEPVPAL